MMKNEATIPSGYKLTFFEKIGYGIGDFGANLLFIVLSSYLTYYFTDIYGLEAAAVGTLLIVVRILDMFDSPIYGVLIDKTNTRWGKSRPWILWGSFPLAIFIILLFMVPDLSHSGKLAYAYIFYILVSLSYSAVNLPLSTILPSLTTDSDERTVANTIRMFLGQFGSLVANMTLLPLVGYFGDGNEQKGFFYTVVVYAIICLICSLITFFNTKERVKVPQEQSQPIKESMKAIKGNYPWIATVFIGILGFTMIASRMTSTMYYFIYNIERPDILSLILTLSSLTLLGILLIPIVTKKYGKKNSMIIGFVFFIIGQLLIFLAGANVPILIIGTVISAMGGAIPIGLLFSVMADTADYGEWKSGVRAQGFLISFSGIGIKLGGGLGAAIPAWLLAAGGYVPNQQQTELALKMISISYIWIPTILAFLGILVIVFLYKWEKPYEEIIQDLENRRMKENEGM